MDTVTLSSSITTVQLDTNLTADVMVLRTGYIAEVYIVDVNARLTDEEGAHRVLAATLMTPRSHVVVETQHLIESANQWLYEYITGFSWKGE
jgi:hypothetical protein